MAKVPFALPKLSLDKVATGGGWALGENYSIMDKEKGILSSEAVDAKLAKEAEEKETHSESTVINDQRNPSLPTHPAIHNAPKVPPLVMHHTGPTTPPLGFDVTGPALHGLSLVAPQQVVTAMVTASSPDTEHPPAEKSSPVLRKCDFGSEVSSVICPSITTGAKCILTQCSTEVWVAGASPSKDGTVQTYDLRTITGELQEGRAMTIKSTDRTLGDDVINAMVVVNVVNPKKGSLPLEEVHIWCGYNNGKITVWSLDARKKVQTFNAHRIVVTALVHVKSLGKVWSSSLDGTIRIWDVATRTMGQRVPKHKTGGVKDLAYIPSTNHVWSCGSDGSVCAWTMEGLLWKTIDSKLTSVACLRVDVSDKTVWAGSESHKGGVHCWDACTGASVWRCSDLNAHALEVTERFVIIATRQVTPKGEFEALDSLLFVTRDPAKRVALRIPNLHPILRMSMVTPQFLVTCFHGEVGSKLSVFALADVSLRPIRTFEEQDDPSRQHHPALSAVMTQDLVETQSAAKSEDTILIKAVPKDTVSPHDIPQDSFGSMQEAFFPKTKPPIPPLHSQQSHPSPGRLLLEGRPTPPLRGQQRSSERDNTPSGDETSKKLRRMERKLDILLGGLPERQRVTEHVNDLVHLYGYAQALKAELLPHATLSTEYTERPLLDVIGSREGRTIGAVMLLLAEHIKELTQQQLHSIGGRVKDSCASDVTAEGPQPHSSTNLGAVPSSDTVTPLLLRILAEVTSRRNYTVPEAAAPTAPAPGISGHASYDPRIDELVQYVRWQSVRLRQDEEKQTANHALPAPTPSTTIVNEKDGKMPLKTSDDASLQRLFTRSKEYAARAAQCRKEAEEARANTGPTPAPSTLCRNHARVYILVSFWHYAEVRTMEAKLRQSRKETTKVGLSGKADPLIMGQIRESQKMATVELGAAVKAYSQRLSLEGYAAELAKIDATQDAERPVAAYHAWCRFLLETLEMVEASAREGETHVDIPELKKDWASRARELEKLCKELGVFADDITQSEDSSYGDRLVLLEHRAQALADYLLQHNERDLAAVAEIMHGRVPDATLVAQLSELVYGTTPRAAHNVLAGSVDGEGYVDGEALKENIRNHTGTTITSIRALFSGENRKY